MNTTVAVTKFHNGYFCKQCDQVTEHMKTTEGLVCNKCGSVLYFQRPDVKAKQREYRQRPDVKARQRERQKKGREQKLKKG